MCKNTLITCQKSSIGFRSPPFIKNESKKRGESPFLFQTPSSPNLCERGRVEKAVMEGESERVKMKLDLTGLPKHAQRNRDEVDTEQAF